jgi:hypothetical protein
VEYNPVDLEEMKLRKNKDYNALLKMIAEGGPVFEAPDRMGNEEQGYDEKDLPRDYQ